jgi:hypothetical protein
MSSSTTTTTTPFRAAATAGEGAANGFFAPQYPPFHLPSRQRGSVAVHGGDGRRFVANENGGVGFAEPFLEGETVGLGIEFRLGPPPAAAGRPDLPFGRDGGRALTVRVFFTREGRAAGGFDWRVSREGCFGGEGQAFKGLGSFLV